MTTAAAAVVEPAANPTLSKLMSKPATAKLVERFIAGLPQRVSALQDALKASEMNRLKVLAHQLKGAAGGYGFTAISQDAAKLETAIIAGADPSAISANVATLSSLCTQIRGQAA